MPTCPWCGHRYREQATTSPSGARICPRCGRDLRHPSATIPFADPESAPTMLSVQANAGFLADHKRYALAVVSGNEPGKVFQIHNARITIGRVDCDVTLEDPKLSRQHALIAISGNAARLEDLASTNGTFVDGRQIDQADLDDRTEFRVGDHVLLFLMSDRETDGR